MRKFANYLGSKDLRTATEKDLKQFFTENKAHSSYNLLAIKLTSFYRWVEDLSKRETPKRMTWFEYAKPPERDTKKIKEEFITDDEYKRILEGSGRDRFGMWSALWETFYLSGARLGEVSAMRIKDVNLQGGRCVIYVPESKTKTREIPFSSYPFLLERWVHNHPQRDNPEAPLWISNSSNNLGNQLNENSICGVFWKLRKRLGLRDALSVHNFRKTRATVMFNERAKDGGLIYNDSQMALYFGWSVSQVGARRRQYDLNGFEDLKKLVFSQSGTSTVEDYDIVKREKQELTSSHEKQLQLLSERLKRTEEGMSQLLEAIELNKEELVNLVRKPSGGSCADCS